MFDVKRQIWVKPEAIEGIFSTPTIANAKYAFKPEAKPDRTEIEDERAQRTLSKAATQIAQKRWDFTYGLDLKGGGHIAGTPNLPESDTDLRMSGFRVQQCYKAVGGSAITGGPILHGETFVQAVSGATGIIIGQYSGTPAKIHYRPTGINGTLNNVNVVTTSGGATFTPGTGEPHGFAYLPESEVWSVAARAAWSGLPQNGEVVRGVTSGAVGLLLDYGAPHGSVGSVSIDFLLGGPGPFVSGETILGLTSGFTAVLSSAFVLSQNISTSIADLLDGANFKAYGCRANVSIPLKGGDQARVNFAAKGLEQAVETLPIPTGALYDTTSAPRFVSAHFLLDGKPFKIEKFEIDMGNVLKLDSDVNAPEGAVSYRITGRNPRVRLDPAFLPPAAYDFFQKWTDSSLVSAVIRLGASETELGASVTTGRNVWIDMPKIQYVAIPLGNRNGIVTAEIEGALRQGTTAGNDEIVIYFL